MITDINIKDFCKRHKLNEEFVYRYLFAITHPNNICARCVNYDITDKIKRQNVVFDSDGYPCKYCTRNPKHKNYFSGLSD